jgi:hypothetical protein
MLADVEAVQRAVEVDVRDDQVKPLGSREVHRALGLTGELKLPPRRSKYLGDDATRVAIVINDENSRHWQYPTE